MVVRPHLLQRGRFAEAEHVGIGAGIGLTAPPIGLNVFVVSTIARDVPITSTYRRVLPFLAADAMRLALVVIFPGLALWLVRLLN